MNRKMKKYKNITLSLVIAATIASSLSGCFFGGNEVMSSDNSSAVTSGSVVSSNPAPVTSENTDSGVNNNVNGRTITEILRENIAKAYNDNYLPNMAIPEEDLETQFGITSDMYDEIVAEMPTIGFHPDRLIIVKAKEGKADMIENAFKNAKNLLTENNTQYPQNLAKIAAAKVLRNGDYVCFMLLGKPNESGENDESAAQFAEDQVNIGVKEFENFFENVNQ
ncbi:MAG: DUF4358 domain-containing protein [Ruminococcaceae bacterium]|nr:DUF4358 domain-containing protein [Oscillospiraceae bacterium]